MAVIWTRIDEKLIHGQIVVAWVPHLNIDTIIIPDQDTKNDIWSQTIMEMGLPPEVQTAIFTSPSQLIKILDDKSLNDARILVLFKNIKAFFLAVETGFKPEQVNLGNHICRSPAEDIHLTDTFYATDQELATLTDLWHKGGLEIILQAVPAGKVIVWQPRA